MAGPADFNVLSTDSGDLDVTISKQSSSLLTTVVTEVVYIDFDGESENYIPNHVKLTLDLLVEQFDGN